MTAILTQFEDRVAEIDSYFEFLRLVVVQKAKLTYSSKKKKVEGIDSDLAKILKANAFLLLYNLVESSIRDGLQRIYEAIIKERLTYERLRKELREVWVHHMVSPDSQRTVENSAKRVMDIIDKVVADELVVLDVKFISLAGNVDAAKVRKLADRYGFSHRTSARTQGGAVLLDVKRERNNLAHGYKSFAECGRDLTYKSLLATKNQAILYTRQILKNMDDYIDNKHYKLPL